MEAGCAYTSMLHGMLHPGCWARAVKAKAPRRARRRAAMATLAAQDKNQCRWITKRTFLLFWRHTRQNCMRDIFQLQATHWFSVRLRPPTWQCTKLLGRAAPATEKRKSAAAHCLKHQRKMLLGGVFMRRSICFQIQNIPRVAQDFVSQQLEIAKWVV